MLIDSHTHVYGSEFDADRAAVFERARQAGVDQMAAVGCDLETSRAAVVLAEERADVFATAGIHPHEAKTRTDAVIAELRALARRPKVVAIGEIGLDYHYLHSPKDVQREVFSELLALAHELDKPVVLHTREAWDETFEIVRAASGRPRGVFHCFTGDRAQAERALALGFHISVSGIVTFANANALREVARTVPLDRLMIETDCPYLTPVPFRGQRNEPAHVRVVAEAVARARGIEPAELAAATATNTRQLFRL